MTQFLTLLLILILDLANIVTDLINFTVILIIITKCINDSDVPNELHLIIKGSISFPNLFIWFITLIHFLLLNYLLEEAKGHNTSSLNITIFPIRINFTILTIRNYYLPDYFVHFDPGYFDYFPYYICSIFEIYK